MFNFFKRKKKKEETVAEEVHAGPISDWSYQRFCGFYGDRILPDAKFDDKIAAIISCVKDKHFESIYEFSLDKIEEDLRLLEAIKKRISIQAIERTPEYIKLNFNVEAVKMIDTEDGVWVRNKSNEEETDLLFKFADEMRMAKPLD